MKKVLILIALLAVCILLKGQTQSPVRIGVITDIHDDVGKLQAFIDDAKSEQPDFIIQLGDLSNGKEAINLQMIDVWNRYPGKRYHVLGNHDMDYATKEEIIERQDMPGKYYSFDCKDYAFRSIGL